jgi:large-conductance mechanosensitive channel
METLLTLKSMFNKFYGFLSIGIIELGNLFTNFSNLLTCIIIVFQIAIAILTVIKLWKDIKLHKFKTLNQTEKEIKKKYQFLNNLTEILKKLKL